MYFLEIITTHFLITAKNIGNQIICRSYDRGLRRPCAGLKRAAQARAALRRQAYAALCIPAQGLRSLPPCTLPREDIVSALSWYSPFPRPLKVQFGHPHKLRILAQGLRRTLPGPLPHTTPLQPPPTPPRVSPPRSVRLSLSPPFHPEVSLSLLPSTPAQPHSLPPPMFHWRLGEGVSQPGI